MKQLDLSSKILDPDDYDSLHDLMGDVTDNLEITNEEIAKYWNDLPEHIKLEAVEWGCGDTVVKDNIYEWLETRRKKGD